jgi:hypothetical protein
MALGFNSPAGWDQLDEDTQRHSFLDSDFCVIARPGADYERYIRGLLRLPVLETEAEFQWIVWLSVSEPGWHAYRAGFGVGEYPEPGCFAYLMHEIPDFEGSLGLPVDVRFQPDGLRPLVALHGGDHPLAKAQSEGIDVPQIERWAARMHRGT